MMSKLNKNINYGGSGSVSKSLTLFSALDISHSLGGKCSIVWAKDVFKFCNKM